MPPGARELNERWPYITAVAAAYAPPGIARGHSRDLRVPLGSRGGAIPVLGVVRAVRRGEVDRRAGRPTAGRAGYVVPARHRRLGHRRRGGRLRAALPAG